MPPQAPTQPANNPASQPVQMTRAQYQQKYGSAPSISPPSSNQNIPANAAASQPIQMTRAEYQSKYGQAPSITPPQSSQDDSGVKGGFLGNLLTGSTQKFGKTIGEALAAPENADKYSETLGLHTEVQSNLIKAIQNKKSLGQDTSHLEDVLKRHISETPKIEDFTGDVINKTPEQVIGEGVGTGLEVLSGGVLSGGIESVASKELSLAQKIKQGAKIGATYGAVGGASNSMQNNGSGADVASNALLGGATGAALGSGGELAAVGVSKLPSLVKGLTPTAEGIMNRVARLTPNQASQFEKIAGETHGNYLQRTGNFGTPEQIIKNESSKFANSLNEVDTALSQIPGNYKNENVTTALKDLSDRETRIGVPNEETARIKQLSEKNDSQGLTMSEINEVKRSYERNVKLDFAKQNLPEGVARATRVDNALRNWQFKTASDQGLKNLPQLNKQTQISKFIVDKLGKQLTGKTGNEALNLTDWIILSRGDPTAVAELLVKKGFSSKTVQSKIASVLADKPSSPPIKAQYGGKTGLPSLIPGNDYNVPKPTINLPTSARESNLGLDEVKNTIHGTRETQLPVKQSIKTYPKDIPQEEPYVKPENLPTIQMGTRPPSKYKTPVKGLPTIQGKVTPAVLGSIAGGTALGVGLGKTPQKLNYTADNSSTNVPMDTSEKPSVNPERISSALLSLESSNGKNTASADPGEKKWLTGLTKSAIDELKRTGVKKAVDVNNKADVIDASVKYFNLLQKRNPDLSPAEVYVDKYWTQATSTKQRQQKINEFNRLIAENT